MKKYHLISGLPRSGSTLLSAILNQNPRFQSSITDPVFQFVSSIINNSEAGLGFRFEVPVEKRKQLIQAIMDTYYDNPEKEVAFNTSRAWGLKFNTMKALYPDLKMIFCVRDLGWVLDSFERLHAKQPFAVSKMFGMDQGSTVFTRCNTLIDPNGTVGSSYNAMREALAGEHNSSTVILDYDYFTKNPEVAMKAIYNFLGEPYFDHDFDNVESSYDEYDADLGLPGLHTTRKKVEFIPRQTILPQEIWDNCKGMEFWKPAK